MSEPTAIPFHAASRSRSVPLICGSARLARTLKLPPPVPVAVAMVSARLATTSVASSAICSPTLPSSASVFAPLASRSPSTCQRPSGSAATRPAMRAGWSLTVPSSVLSTASASGVPNAPSSEAVPLMAQRSAGAQPVGQKSVARACTAQRRPAPVSRWPLASSRPASPCSAKAPTSMRPGVHVAAALTALAPSASDSSRAASVARSAARVPSSVSWASCSAARPGCSGRSSSASRLRAVSVSASGRASASTRPSTSSA